MGNIVIFTNTTLDGVIQAPGRPDEDTRNGFEYGGWAAPYNAMQEAGDSIANIGALLVGRVTYEGMYDFWPKQVDNPMTDMLAALPKYVVSTTLQEPLSWENSILISDDVANQVAEAKRANERDLVIFGSGELCRTLMREDLIDECVLLIHPLILGTGLKLFPEGSPPLTFELANSKSTSTGVTVLSYKPRAA